MENSKNQTYNHYLAIDWSQNNCTIASMTGYSEEPRVVEIAPDIKLLKNIVNNHKGNKILAVEETTSSHWIYVEMKDFVDKVLVCNPYRNRLLSEGPKDDKIDARKLCLLLRGGFLKEVYHSCEADYYIRKLASAYDDLVKASVRVKNQRSSIYRSEGLKYKKDKIDKKKKYAHFVEAQQLRTIAHFDQEQKQYEKEFASIRKNNQLVKYLSKVPGLGDITSVKIYATVIDARRFTNKYKFWAYCGLVYHLRESGKRYYGRKLPKYSRVLKTVFKSATVAALRGKSDIRDYYEQMLKKGISERDAKSHIARYIAKVSFAIMKTKTPYIAYQWRKADVN